MSKTIQHKRSSIAGNKPDDTQIAVGELAINFPDKTIYTKDANGQIIEVGESSPWVETVDGIEYVDGKVGISEELTFETSVETHSLEAKESSVGMGPWVYSEQVRSPVPTSYPYHQGCLTLYGGGNFISFSNFGQQSTWQSYSDDGGYNWKSAGIVPKPLTIVMGGVYAETIGKWVVVSAYTGVSNKDEDLIIHSDDGINWTVSAGTSGYCWRDVATDGNRFVAVADVGIQNQLIQYSDDGGVTWTVASASSSSEWNDGQWTSVGYDPTNERWVALSRTDYTMYSDDGINWFPGGRTPVVSISKYSGAIDEISSFSGRESGFHFVQVSAEGRWIATSEQGNQGTSSNPASNTYLDKMIYSDDGGVTWYDAATGFAGPIIYAQGRFVCSNAGYYSDDGLNWTSYEMPFGVIGTDHYSYEPFKSIAYGEGRFLQTKYIPYNDDVTLITGEDCVSSFSFAGDRSGLFYDGALLATEDNLQPLFDKVNSLSQPVSQLNPWVETETGIEYTAGFAEVSETPTQPLHIVNKKYVDSKDITLPDGGGESSEIIWNGNTTTLTATWPLLISADNVNFGSTATIQQGRTLYLIWDGAPGSGSGIDSPHGTVLEGTVTSSEGEVWYYEFTVQKEVTFLIHESVDSNEEVGGYSTTRTYEVTGVNSYVYPHGSSTGDSAQYELLTNSSTRQTGYLDLPATDISSPASNFMVNGDTFRLRHRNANAIDTASTYNIKMAGDSAGWTTVTAGAAAVPTTPRFTSPHNSETQRNFDVDGMIISSEFKQSDGTTTGHVSTDWEITKVNLPCSTGAPLPEQRYSFYHPNFGYHVMGREFDTDGTSAASHSTDGQTWSYETNPRAYVMSRTAMAANDNILIAVGQNPFGHNYNTIYWTEDGIAWNYVHNVDKGTYDPPLDQAYDRVPQHMSVIWTGTHFFIFAKQHGAHYSYSTMTAKDPAMYVLLYSSDGKTWTDGSAGVVAGSVEPEELIMSTVCESGQSMGSVWTGTKLIAIFNGYEVMSSPDGFTWTSEHIFDHIVDMLSDYPAGDVDNYSLRAHDRDRVKLTGFKHYDPETGYFYVDTPAGTGLRAHIDDLSTWTEIEPVLSGRKAMSLPTDIVYDSDEGLYIGLGPEGICYCRDSELINWFAGHTHRPAGNPASANTSHIATTKTPQGWLCAITNTEGEIAGKWWDRSRYVPVGYITFESEYRIADTTNLTTYEPSVDAMDSRFMRVRYNTDSESSLWSDTVELNTGGAEGWYQQQLLSNPDTPNGGFLWPVGTVGPGGAGGGNNWDIPADTPENYVVNTNGFINAKGEEWVRTFHGDQMNNGLNPAAQSTTAMHYGTPTGAYGFVCNRIPQYSSDPSYPQRTESVYGSDVAMLNLYLQDRGEGNDDPASRWWSALVWSPDLFADGQPLANHYLVAGTTLSEFVYADDSGNNEYAILTLSRSSVAYGHEDAADSIFAWSVMAFESPHNGDLRMYPTAYVSQAEMAAIYGVSRPEAKILIRDFSTEHNPLTIAVGSGSGLAHINLVTRNDGSTSPTITMRSELLNLFPGVSVEWQGGVHDGTQFIISGTSGVNIYIATSPDGITWTDRSAALRSKFDTTTWPMQELIDEGVESFSFSDEDQLYYAAHGKTKTLLWNGNELRIWGNLGIMFTSTDGGVSWTRDTSFYDHMQNMTKRGRPGTVFSMLWHQTYDLAGNARNGYWHATSAAYGVAVLAQQAFYASTQTPGNEWKSPATRIYHQNSGYDSYPLALSMSNNEILIGHRQDTQSNNDTISPSGIVGRPLYSTNEIPEYILEGLEEILGQ